MKHMEYHAGHTKAQKNISGTTSATQNHIIHLDRYAGHTKPRETSPVPLWPHDTTCHMTHLEYHTGHTKPRELAGHTKPHNISSATLPHDTTCHMTHLEYHAATRHHISSTTLATRNRVKYLEIPTDCTKLYETFRVPHWPRETT